MNISVWILAVPIALTWLALTATDRPLESFGVGYVIGVLLLVVLRVHTVKLEARRLPSQGWAVLQYSALLCRDIWLSAMDVARRVLDPKLPLKLGIIAVPTGEDDEVIAAFSAHGITITPGELVVDFDGRETMYVHCLDVEASAASAPTAQAKRAALLRRVLGKD
jgi:multicomponent Na+:H+ antiporter subunit E